MTSPNAPSSSYLHKRITDLLKYVSLSAGMATRMPGTSLFNIMNYCSRKKYNLCPVYLNKIKNAIW